MAVEHTSGLIIYASQSCSTRAQIISFLNTQLQNAGWTTSGIALGYKLTSAATPHGLRCKVWLEDNSETVTGAPAIRVRVSNYSEDKISGAATANGSQITCAAAGSTFTIVANRYQFFLFELAGGYTAYRWFGCGVPFLPTPLRPKVITNATTASPCVITSAAHGFSNGDQVYVCELEGLTGINGSTYTVANKTTDTFELSGSTSGGSYTGGGLVAKLNSQVAEAIWMADSPNAASRGLFRTAFECSNTTAGAWSTLNGNTVRATAGSTIGGPALTILDHNLGPATPSVTYYNNSYAVWDAQLLLSTSSGVQGRIVGQLWDAFCVAGALTLDQTSDAPFDGTHNYIMLGASSASITNKSRMGLVVATS